MPDQTDLVEQLPAQRPTVRRRDSIRTHRVDAALDHFGARRPRGDVQPQPERRVERLGFQRSARIARAEIANARELHDSDLPAGMLNLKDDEERYFPLPHFPVRGFANRKMGDRKITSPDRHIAVEKKFAVHSPERKNSLYTHPLFNLLRFSLVF